VILAVLGLVLMGGRRDPGSPQRTAFHRPVAAALPRLTTTQLAGQRIIYAYSGLRPPQSLLRAIRAGEAGGVIFFSPNVSSTAQLHRVVAALQKAARAGPVRAPLLMLTDQEGGAVRRLPGAPVLSEKQIGTSANRLAAARAAGRGAAHTLAAAGVNVNLAPVLDVYRSAGNFIDEFGRSYSNQPATVRRLGAAFIAAQQHAGVAATGKHFPGLGAAARSQNTDLRPVTLSVPLARLRSVDEAPYPAAIAAGLKLVMTSWAVYPALDPVRPAGLSPTVIGGELRGRLHFRGVTITDALSAGPLHRFGGLGRRGVLAARAGADLLLCSAADPSGDAPAQGTAVMRAVAAALSDHQLSVAAARQSVARIVALRRHL
jgi:beta-N-acetylhexosaminidase